jgi:phosphate transport system protein
MPTLLERELNQLRDRFLMMGELAEDAIDWAMRALVDNDSALAERVLADDDKVDALELEMDRACIRVLALRSPEARDLRFVIAVSKLTPILERIADHACNVARVELALRQEPRLEPNSELGKMGQLVRKMLHDALQAFAASDAKEARAVMERDDRVNILYHKVLQDLLDQMSYDVAATGQAARLLLVAKHLERIGDYVTDICEQIVYMKEALVIKHPGLIS